MKIFTTLARHRATSVALMMAAGSLTALDVAAAVPIPGLFSTGTDNVGAVLLAGAADTHYALSKSGGDGPSVGTSGFVAPDSGFPIGYWVANTATSKWLAPAVNAAATYDATSNGIYTWTLSFNLSGYDPLSASFSGRWATDNSGQIKLNGTLLAVGSSSGFNTWTNFSSTGGSFATGLNTLDFIVTNLAQSGGNPTGLQVQFLSSSVTPVPEPESYGMLLAGLGLVGFVTRRRLLHSGVLA
ncbi:PEP-CTERM sorting domain-containing protein [Accumulibacter sp.]|jgi:hypothetical protein|uniref:Ice-binding protein C-terminal domain-containing protein n=1 Tax=Accumulibacter regalis TaxID=522306 RepID=C7RNR2_ACCRE|nr:PEP-CTERM sorting domain-containing protein [Accumulibacter sp.]MBN8499131.1 PEP-CTERM sorting domain-containing protein [Accumulibacter sp.]MBO3714198.1 PEP-CTERM sorting domain-containing protein [Accumulibacter sp.]